MADQPIQHAESVRTPESVAALLVELEREGWLGIDVSYTAYVMPHLVQTARMAHCCEHGRLVPSLCRWCGDHNDGPGPISEDGAP